MNIIRLIIRSFLEVIMYNCKYYNFFFFFKNHQECKYKPETLLQIKYQTNKNELRSS